MFVRVCLLSLCLTGLPLGARADDAQPQDARSETATTDEPVRQLLSGRVVYLPEALAKRGIRHYADEMKTQVVLDGRDGQIYPIISDWRGRAFYQDERLRDRPVDIIVLRHAGVPHIRVQSIYVFDEKGARKFTDYWCDICSIPMYEIKDCECCQGPIRLRFQDKPLPEDFRQEKEVEPEAAKASEKSQ